MYSSSFAFSQLAVHHTLPLEEKLSASPISDYVFDSVYCALTSFIEKEIPSLHDSQKKKK